MEDFRPFVIPANKPGASARKIRIIQGAGTSQPPVLRYGRGQKAQAIKVGKEVTT